MHARIFTKIHMWINICLISLCLKLQKHSFIGFGEIRVFIDVRAGVDLISVPKNGPFQKWTFLVS